MHHDHTLNKWNIIEMLHLQMIQIFLKVSLQETIGAESWVKSHLYLFFYFLYTYLYFFILAETIAPALLFYGKQSSRVQQLRGKREGGFCLTKHMVLSMWYNDIIMYGEMMTYLST